MAELLSLMETFVTEGERRAAEVLKQLPASWLVICNKTLPTSNGHSYEIDFIIVGKRWIFLLEEKSWKGKIRGNEEQWVRADGSSERSPLSKADYVAKVLAGSLKWKVPSLNEGGHFVRGGVLLSASEQLPTVLDPRATHGIFLLTDVCQHLQVLDSQGGNPHVGQVRDLIKKALINLSDRPAIPKQVGLYTINDTVTIRPGVRLFNATNDSGEPRLLMMYNLGRDPLIAQENRKFYLHERDTLKELHTTGLVAEVQDIFEWSDDFLVLPIIPLRGKSLSAFRLPETREELLQELQIAIACFKGLDIIHSKSVLHRAIGPNTIYIVQEGQNPKIAFTHFFAARIGTSTIAASLDKLSLAYEDPYASLDLAIGYEHATANTDLFSLALVFLERIAGISITAIRPSVENDITFPDLTKRWSILPTDVILDLSELFKQIILPKDTVSSTALSAKEIVTTLQDLARRLRIEPVQEDREVLNGRFKIQRFLGQGAWAKTYLASYTDYAELGLCVLKRFLRPEEVYKQAVDEYRALQQVKSKYIPRIEEIYRQQDDVHIKMEYIPGPTLIELESTFPWSLDRWWSFAQHLMNAIEELEKKQILHRDIKPENIIFFEEEQYPVLIDFGFALSQHAIAPVRGAGTPLYLPPEATLTSTPPTCDRYAASIILFRMLTGQLPFDLSEKERSPRIPDIAVLTNLKTRKVAETLLHFVSLDPSQRPLSVVQMRQELQAAMLSLEADTPTTQHVEKINTWVDDIRSLYRNSESGNANNRGLDTPFVRDTYVQTALDQRLLPAILEHRPKAVFLSGNPGDGKTAFLEQIRAALEEKQAIFSSPDDASGWECTYDGHTFRSCYDASESHDGLSANEQLAQKLQGLEGHHLPNIALTVLIAINDGRLGDYFDREKEQFHWLAEQIEHAGKESEIKHTPVWIVDLKRRAFVAMPEAEDTSIFTRVLQRLVDEKHWTICEECIAASICPIRNNALALRKKSINKWLEYLLLLIHLRRQRHMTMRDLRSTIAYLITGNSSCQQIHQARHGDDAGASLIHLSYWHLAFAPLEKNDEQLQDIALLDPARFAQPQLDRFLHFHQSLSEVETRRLLFTNRTDLSPERFRDESEWIAAIKRRLYFEVSKAGKEKSGAAISHSIPTIRRQHLLPYLYTRDFIAMLDRRFDEEQIAKLRELLALGILRSDGIIEDVPEGKLSVQVNASEKQQLVVLKQFPLEDFEVYAEVPNNIQVIEQIPELIILQHMSGTPRLEITLDLFELLMRMANGLLPNAQEYQPLLEDLKHFKDTLLLQGTSDLVLIENQYRVHYITQRDGHIVRTDGEEVP